MGKINERKVESNKRKPLKRNDIIAEKEKLKMQHKYNKMMRKEAKTSSSSSNQMRPSQRVHPNRRKQLVEEQTTKYKTVNQRAKVMYEEKQQEKQREKEEEERKASEKQNAIQKYKNNKKDKFKKLCKKTKNGQILMGKQVDTLLAKIQKAKEQK